MLCGRINTGLSPDIKADYSLQPRGSLQEKHVVVAYIADLAQELFIV